MLIAGSLPSTTTSLPSCGVIQLFRSTRLAHHMRKRCATVSCRASASSSSITEFDLYDLLGIESSSDQSQIKKAYRALQKRCHPDIAGSTGHDMAIILNEAYSILSDPNSRFAYDKEQAKISEFHGYTGKPLYSTWCGSASEQRAVFVDEVKCVGCLKCALFASNTFAIESVYGRARVVSQWADPEDKILDAIQTCPVDCISMVDRSDLAALEFLMSKQPRGNVRMTSGNTAGVRVSNIFVDIEKFQKKYTEMKKKGSKKETKQVDAQREAREAAMQGIRSMANWLYWKAPKSATPNVESSRSFIALPERSTSKHQQPDTERLHQAAAQRRSRGKSFSTGCRSHFGYIRDEYWTPALVLPSPSTNSEKENSPLAQPSDISIESKENKEYPVLINMKEENPVAAIIPAVFAIFSAVIVTHENGRNAGFAIEQHIGGSLALEIVNSFQMQILLAGVTWYILGSAVVGLIRFLGSQEGPAK